MGEPAETKPERNPQGVDCYRPPPGAEGQVARQIALQIPLQVVTWILRDVYIDGEEYTMGGKPMRLQRVQCPPDEDGQDETPTESPALLPRPDAKIIALKDLRKKK